MATRAELQAERFVRTLCPAKATRKKLRSLMWQNRHTLTGSSLLAKVGRKRGEKRFYRAPLEKTNNLSVFKDMIQSFGGIFEEFTHTGERKKHTSGRRESRPVFVPKERIKDNVQDQA